MEKKTQDIEDFTVKVLGSIPKPWPNYITLLLFLAIENNEEFLQQYWKLVDKYNQIEKYKGDGQGHLNTTIPKIVKRESDWEKTGESKKAKSTLIKTYSELV